MSTSKILKRAAKLAAKWERERGIEDEDISIQDAIRIAQNGPTPQHRRGVDPPGRRYISRCFIWSVIKKKHGLCPHCGQEH